MAAMSKKTPYGPKLTLEEYERALVDLHSGLPPMPSKAEDRAVRQHELNLSIDHRLGHDFPQDRRQALWAIQEQVEKKRLGLAFKYLFRKLLHRGLYRDVQGIAGFMVEEYAKVLSDAEVREFFELGENEVPTLPVDPKQLKK